MSPIHASCVAIGGKAVLIAGPSGSGKSDLALRLIDRGATLVSDDYTVLARSGDRLLASAPATIAGLMEVRGVGIVTLHAAHSAPVALYVEAGNAERMPEPAKWDRDGVVIQRLRLNLLEPSAPIKVELALRALP